MESKFHDLHKLSNIVPVQKKEDPTDKKNYRPNGEISSLSKVFEKVMYEQLHEYLNKYLIDLLCSFCKAYSTQYVVSRLIQSLKKGLNNSGLVGTILIDLSKALDCLPYHFLTAILDVYGLDKPSLNLVRGYLRFRKQRGKIGS